MNSPLETPTADPQVASGDEVAVPRGQKFLGTPDICARLGIERHTWRRWVLSGYAPLPAPLPGHPRWLVSDIERFERGRR